MIPQATTNREQLIDQLAHQLELFQQQRPSRQEFEAIIANYNAALQQLGFDVMPLLDQVAALAEQGQGREALLMIDNVLTNIQNDTLRHFVRNHPLIGGNLSAMEDPSAPPLPAEEAEEQDHPDQTEEQQDHSILEQIPRPTIQPPADRGGSVTIPIPPAEKKTSKTESGLAPSQLTTLANGTWEIIQQLPRTALRGAVNVLDRVINWWNANGDESNV